jgi:hypothetical protein
MTNALYPKGKEGFLDGSIDWDTDNIKVALCRGYTYDSADSVRDDLAGITVVATSGNLSGKSVTNGVADAADVTFTAVGAGAACDSLIIYKDNGSSATDRVIAYIDTGSGLPVTPNGSDIIVQWSSGASKIFAL